jgi:alkyl hydroperoxide reductase subunit D
MSIEQLNNQLPEFAKDIKLNLANIFSNDGAPDLTPKQIAMIALASAYTTKNAMVIGFVATECSNHLIEQEIIAAKAAASIMAMNNIYYRFVHLSNDQSFAALPAKLRMNIMANPGIDKIDFELCCLAVSALNGCGRCIEAHTHELIKAGITKLAIQSSVRIAAVLNATAIAVALG